MPRTPARCTLADLNRAVKAAALVSYEVRLMPDGTIVMQPVQRHGKAETPQLDKEAVYVL